MVTKYSCWHLCPTVSASLSPFPAWNAFSILLFFFLSSFCCLLMKVSNKDFLQSELFGYGKRYTKIDCQRLLSYLILKDVLGEIIMINQFGSAVAHLQPGRRAVEIMDDKLEIFFHVRPKKKEKQKKLGGAKHQRKERK